jgi:hypothetical protein
MCEDTRIVQGYWIYGFLEEMPLFVKTTFILSSIALCGGCYFGGKAAHGVVWGKRKLKKAITNNKKNK